jgi:hypothetical protein
MVCSVVCGLILDAWSFEYRLHRYVVYVVQCIPRQEAGDRHPEAGIGDLFWILIIKNLELILFVVRYT